MTRIEFLTSVSSKYKDNPDIFSEKEIDKILSEQRINDEGYDNLFSYIIRNYRGTKYPPVAEFAEAVMNCDLTPHSVSTYYDSALTNDNSKHIYTKWHKNFKQYTENSHKLSQKDEEIIKYNMLWSDMVYIYDKLVEIGWEEERIITYCDRVCDKIRSGGEIDLMAFSAKIEQGIRSDSHGDIFMRRIVNTAMGNSDKAKRAKQDYYRR